MEQTMMVGNPQAQGQSGRFGVLFVDDEAMALEAFDMACGGYFPVFTASCAEEAVDVLKRHGNEIAVCISDQRMPQKSGVDFLKEARRQHPHIVRLLTTAYADQGATIAALNEAEIFRYIPKPWDVTLLRQELAGAMAHFVQRRRDRELLCERRSTMLKVAGHLVHELRGSFVTIGLGVRGIRRYLPTLLTAYDKAQAAGLDGVQTVGRLQRQSLGDVLDSMDAQVCKAEVLMDLILSQARVDTTDSTQFGDISMASCVEQALTGFPFAKGQRQLLRVDVGDDFRFYGAPPLVVHLLFNLLRNALLAVETADKGDVYLRLERGDVFNRLYVRDTGTGIAPEVFPHIFEDFFSTRSAGQGSGIGLGFCRVAAEAMGGMIDCRSSEGVFTEFVLSLPPIKKLGE